eukprot:snap_masked-scaffold_16-processed-gene-6.81-mRNA-1 protein AED:1.00 eAED:1.00 QI:0/0/0/0/1/1/2/0/73
MRKSYKCEIKIFDVWERKLTYTMSTIQEYPRKIDLHDNQYVQKKFSWSNAPGVNVPSEQQEGSLMVSLLEIIS